MFNNRRNIPKWTKGPGGFKSKANQQIEAIEQRLPGIPDSRGLLADRAIVLSQDSFWAKITGNAADGTNKWKYAWTEQQRTAAGWQDLSGGRSGTTSTGFAVNANEANNDGTGVQGNSIDIDGTVFDDNSDLEIQPVQGDPVVRMWAELSSTNTLVYTFEYVNAVDGECA